MVSRLTSIGIAALVASAALGGGAARASATDLCVPAGATVVASSARAVVSTRESTGDLIAYGCLKAVGTPRVINSTDTVAGPKLLDVLLAGNFAATRVSTRDGDPKPFIAVADLRTGAQLAGSFGSALSGLAASGHRVAYAGRDRGRSFVWVAAPTHTYLVAADPKPITGLTLHGWRLSFLAGGVRQRGTVPQPLGVRVHLANRTIGPHDTLRVSFRATERATAGHGYYNVDTDTPFAEAVSTQCSSRQLSFTRGRLGALLSVGMRQKSAWCAGTHTGTVLYAGGTLQPGRCPTGRFGCGSWGEVGRFHFTVRKG